MTQIKTGGVVPDNPTPLDSNALLGLPQKKKGFEENLKEGNQYEAAVRYVLALEVVDCYGTQPGKHDDGSPINNAKEQRDIVLFRPEPYTPAPSWTARNLNEWRPRFTRNNTRCIEVKSRGTLSYDTLMLDHSPVWAQKDPEPTAVIMVDQGIFLESGCRKGLLVAHIPTVRHALKKVVSCVWDKATQRHRWKNNIEVPKELCWTWEEFIERAQRWQQYPVIATWEDSGAHEGVYEDRLLTIVTRSPQGVTTILDNRNLHRELPDLT